MSTFVWYIRNTSIVFWNVYLKCLWLLCCYGWFGFSESVNGKKSNASCGKCISWHEWISIKLDCCTSRSIHICNRGSFLFGSDTGITISDWVSAIIIEPPIWLPEVAFSRVSRRSCDSGAFGPVKVLLCNGWISTGNLGSDQIRCSVSGQLIRCEGSVSENCFELILWKSVSVETRVVRRWEEGNSTVRLWLYDATIIRLLVLALNLEDEGGELRPVESSSVADIVDRWLVDLVSPSLPRSPVSVQVIGKEISSTAITSNVRPGRTGRHRGSDGNEWSGH